MYRCRSQLQDRAVSGVNWHAYKMFQHANTAVGQLIRVFAVNLHQQLFVLLQEDVWALLTK